MNELEIRGPVRVYSPNNKYSHHMANAGRTKKIRRLVHNLLLPWWGRRPKVGPFTILFTYCAPRRLDKDDNLNIAFKPARDEVAEFLGINDGDLKHKWNYAWLSGKSNPYRMSVPPYGIIVKIEGSEQDGKKESGEKGCAEAGG